MIKYEIYNREEKNKTYFIFSSVQLFLRHPACDDAWHLLALQFSEQFILTINILLFFEKFVILGFFAGKPHNLIGKGRFQGAQDFFDP